ncbi:Peptidyl-prolyl cis-trans isomerase D (PPIase D) (40 kDa peptidyl-prolyl cis-trans isomerase) (Cyclophilin-40) (CYP-40) (Cyclophilin-related protein) (Rotamase D) [Durusdinium trenchii]|uniref:Peptidyl-prolyl cis-trans isomerase D (PPIase D) (40 kDa peptidyl-prolyl cis-trans isomerase) (Cyclophilin-40) (CYP-40) (Cyclophilin-related protein) (Rotamase D) n=1 Tax=Durusdinium trenchii TaxID=1381693 RepID=A0ABP0R9R0_9DINO
MSRPGKNPRVYLDISIGSRTGGRVIIELFPDITPRAAENFRGLCTGEYGLGRNTKKRLSYEGCQIFRSVKNFMIQTGDFQFNNGDGGESIYGGTFNDEDFVRRHTQAGVVSMANKGRNSNGSQFFITLKRSVQLDNKHIAFGQVVEGMDVIRAVAAVPTDRDERPRVSCTIVGCGEVGAKTQSGVDFHTEMSKQIQNLTEDVAPKANAAQQGKQILAGKPAAGLPPPKTERERKLYELRLKMNQGRVANNKEVIEEQKRESDPGYSKKMAARRTAEEEKKEEAPRHSATVARKSNLPDGKEYLGDTIEYAEQREAKKKKGNPDAFGWDVFNQDSLLRAHEKRLKHVQFNQEAYERQKKEIEEDGDGGVDLWTDLLVKPGRLCGTCLSPHSSLPTSRLA